MYFDFFTALSIFSFQILIMDILTLNLSLCPSTFPTTALFSTEVICPSAHKNHIIRELTNISTNNVLILSMITLVPF